MTPRPVPVHGPGVADRCFQAQDKLLQTSDPSPYRLLMCLSLMNTDAGFFLGQLEEGFIFAWWDGLGCGGKSDLAGFHTHNSGT